MDISFLNDSKKLLGSLAIILTFVAFIPYILSIVRGHTKPHVFSWVIWGIITALIFFAQITEGGGAGAWAMGVSSFITMFIAFLAYIKKSDIAITPTDWIFFAGALLAIPFWHVTDEPLGAVVLLAIVEVAAFIPTIRKTYAKPFDDQLLFFALMGIRNATAIMALEYYSLTTVLFLAVSLVLCIIQVVVMVIRRRCVA